MTRRALLALAVACLALPTAARAELRVTWRPGEPRVADLATVSVAGAPAAATVEGELDGHPLQFFHSGRRWIAITGFDLEAPPGARAWRIAVTYGPRGERAIDGHLRVRARAFAVQRLTLPPAMVDLDPATERRADAEAARLSAVTRTVTPVRLWRGRFTSPLGRDERSAGFGARRVINGQPRMPHGGNDYAAALGAPVLAANAGRVALVAEHFFPGRLVALDHGLGLYTLYFHLDTIAVREGEEVERGQTLGTVGATGRATGPHLHFAVQAGGARVDPLSLFRLPAP